MNRPFRLFLILAAVVGAAVILLATQFDFLVEDAITENGSAMTRARVSVDAVKIALTSGKGRISTLIVNNPEGFRSAHAFRADTIDVDIDIATLASDALVIRVITIDRPEVIYEHGATSTNFDTIQNNITAHLATLRRKNDDEGRKLIVEELTICNATAWASAPFMGAKTISIPLPDITLKNIGKDRGGISPEELGRMVTDVLKTKLSGTASFDRLAKATTDAVDP